MALHRSLAWLFVAASLVLSISFEHTDLAVASIRMGFFLLIVDRVRGGAICTVMSAVGSILFVFGDDRVRLAGSILCLAAVMPLIARARGPVLALMVVAFGLSLDTIDGVFAIDPGLRPLFLGSHDGVRLRMLRLAQVAAIALPLLTLLYEDQISRDGKRLARFGRILMSIGMIGMPLILTAAATTALEVKYLLPIPADAMTGGILIAAVLSKKDGSILGTVGFGLLGASMIVGLLMGGYAFDGPLPSPVGEYGDLGRQLLRSAHVYAIVAGTSMVALIPVRADGTDRVALDGRDLERLNRSSLSKSFVPQTDIDWAQDTTDDEYESLYHVWSLLIGSHKDDALTRTDRIEFVKVQQMTLMRFTALLERHGIFGIAKLYDAPGTQALTEYVGHFIKEEIYHYSMFTKAIEQIQSTMPGKDPPPMRAFDRSLRLIFGAVNLIPSSRIQLIMTFTMFRFAEQVTIYAHDMVRKTVPRKESLIGQVWAHHALDEARHLKFDDMVIEHMRVPGVFSRLPELIILPACVFMSLLLNANEVWAARRLGVRVHLWDLPSLMKRTEAPFKRRVFGLVRRLSTGQGPEEAGA